MKNKILIIGAGLSGIYLGYRLKKIGFSIQILEANDRIGGRIYTKNIQNTTVEFGATWLWKYNTSLINLCKELNITLFEQNMEDDALYEASRMHKAQRFKVPKNQETSYRIAGGTSAIFKILHEYIEENLLLNEKVTTISNDAEIIKISTEKSRFNADFVISTIPPQLLVNAVQFVPELESELKQIANQTHTWMHDSIKFALVYEAPFWRSQGLSGVGFSNIGPFTEIYDHSDFEDQHYALMGFLNRNLVEENKTRREQNVVNQLEKFFGPEARNYKSYQEKVWYQEDLTSIKNNSFLTPHNNNGHSIYQKRFFNDKLIIAGSETSPSYGGYMEGAIFRSNQIINQLIAIFKP